MSDELPKIGRFDHLEIGAAPPPTPAPHAAAHARPDKVLCLHCGQSNEKERETCWACFRSLAPEAAKAKKPKALDEVTIVLDGLTYRSSDPNLPSDIRQLINQIREKGFSQELLAQWRNWRASRNEPRTPDASLVPVENQGKDPLTGNEVFKGQRSAVIRLDGKIYTSTDPDLTPEIKELFQYIETYGVTPALMEHLRLVGKKTTVRPATTPAPTVEDLAFWKDVGHPPQQEKASPGQPAAPADPLKVALDAGSGPRDDSGSRTTAGIVLAASIVLYVLLRLFAGPR